MIPIVYKKDTVLRNGMQYYDVEFVEDFGVFKTGFKTLELFVFYNECVVRTFDPDMVQEFGIYPVVPKKLTDSKELWGALIKGKRIHDTPKAVA